MGRSATGNQGGRASGSEEKKNLFTLYNDPPDSLTIDASQKFIKDVHGELNQGRGFVLFIGAGLSAPSGAPLIWELHHYLHGCISLALGVGEPGRRPWNPRTDQWPPFTYRSRHTQKEWWTRIRDEFEQRSLRDQWDPEVAIFQEALGTLAEWRASLIFLSRVVRETRGSGDATRFRLALDAPNAEVIDNCLRRAMSGRHPTLGHRMLATLATLLRLDVILTTNFDDLLEQAFEEARNPLSVFEVHLASSLPPWSALSEHRSLVKMHGNLYSLRVDYTLDTLPVEADRWRFLEYLLSAEGRSKMAAALGRGDTPDEGLPFRNHLLVMGVSATERRTRAFIEHALRHLDEEFQVFWLCYSQRDVESARRFASEAGVRKERWLRILRHPYLGLLFTELYQTIRCGVPTSGILFPTASRLAIPPMPSVRGPAKAENESSGAGVPVEGVKRPGAEAEKHAGAERKSRSQSATMKTSSAEAEMWAKAEAEKRTGAEVVKRAREDYVAEISLRLDQIQSEGYQNYKLILATSTPSASGVTSACAQVFEQVRERGQVAIWLDMNDISSTDDLFEQLLDAANFRVGAGNLLPAHVPNRPEVQADEILKIVEPTASDCVFFLNARETPGTNLMDGREIEDAEDKQNNWLDDEKPQPMGVGARRTGEPAEPSKLRIDDQSNYCGRFLRFLARLCGPGSPRISVVLMCRQNKNGDPSHLVKTIVEKERLISSATILRTDCSEFKERETVLKAILWPRKEPGREKQRQRFLQALISLQRIRYLATIWTDAACGAVGSEGTKTPLQYSEEPQKPLRWLGELEEIGLVRRKPGGFIWIHSRTRTALRQMLRKSDYLKPESQEAGLFKELEEVIKGWDPSGLASTIHWELAQWYRRILSASGSPGAVFEAVYHACRSAEIQLEQAGSETDVHRALDRVNWASSLLHAHAFLVQTQGHSRGSCRRLGDIRGHRCIQIDDAARSKRSQWPNLADAVSRATRHLRLRCTEIMRAIAREVGEDRRAYDRQRDSRLLLGGGNLDDKDGRPGEAITAMFNAMKAGGDLTLEWVRWWRWLGMLGIASRSYKVAHRSLLRGLLSVSRNDRPPEEIKTFLSGLKTSPDSLKSTLIEIEAACVGGGAKVLGYPVTEHQRLRLEVARILEQLVTHGMQEGSLLFKVPEKENSATDETAESQARIRFRVPADQDVAAHYEDILVRIAITKRVVESIRSNDQSPDSHDTIPALWCQSRLLMHEGMCHGRLNRPIEAMALLADAEAALNVSDSRRRGVDRAIIELHRAEVRLLQAGRVSIPSPGGRKQVCFREFETLIMPRSFNSAIWRADGAALGETYKEKDEAIHNHRRMQLRTARSLIQDALSFLDRADHILSTRRRNVWWMTWFFQRKLLAVSMSVWASILEENTPIPFLGLEAAPRGCPTAADHLLENAIRMIRIDAYRLATVVEAYAGCAAALYIRLYIAGQNETSAGPFDTLAERQTDMMTRLVSATRRLEEVYCDRSENIRIPAPLPGSDDYEARHKEWEHQQKNNALAPSVESYIKAIIKNTEQMAENLKQPLR